MVRKSYEIDERQAYKQLLKACLSLGSKHDLTHLNTLKKDLAQLSKNLHKQVESFKQKISKMPLSAFILLWAEQIGYDKIYESRHLAMMNDLMGASLFPIGASLQDLSEQDPSLIIDKIRCHQEWPIIKREDYVRLYRDFSEWLSKETFAYTSQAQDLDRIASQKRLIFFDTYIKILSHLDLREQILAKIFYLGGQRGLEEVLNIKITDIDFSKACILLSEEEVQYPRHLFDDIKAYIKERKKGFLFLGKDGERISHTTPFRALKKVVSDLTLDPEFTFREFTKNI